MNTAMYEVSLRSTEFIDADDPTVRDEAQRIAAGAIDVKTRATRIFNWVRDHIIYDVYTAPLTRSGMRASTTIRRRTGFCIHKCIAFAALSRSLGIPCKLAFSDVRNHLSTPRFRELVGGDVFHYHTHAEIYMEPDWLKVAPVFNLALCRLFSVPVLEFDGTQDATRQRFGADNSGLETVREHGSFDEFPYESCVDALRTNHPRLFTERLTQREACRAPAGAL